MEDAAAASAANAAAVDAAAAAATAQRRAAPVTMGQLEEVVTNLGLQDLLTEGRTVPPGRRGGTDGAEPRCASAGGQLRQEHGEDEDFPGRCCERRSQQIPGERGDHDRNTRAPPRALRSSQDRVGGAPADP